MAKKLTVALVAITALASVKGAAVLDTLSAFTASPVYAEEPAETDAPPISEMDPIKESQTAKESPVEAAPVTPRELLVAIEMERDKLNEWQNRLEEQEATLSLAQSTLDAKAVELRALKDELDLLLSRSVRENTEDVARLVAIYKAMKPVQAATIMNDAGIEVAVLVLSAMEPRNSGPIIALMQPIRARAISKIILERSRLPGDQRLVNVTLD
nr:hypothetical protein [Amylibacter sp.]